MKIFKRIFFVIFVLMVGILGGIIGDRYFFPYLASTKLFSKYEFLKKSFQDVTFINKTEQIIVREDTSVSKTASQVIPAVVNIISYPNPNSNSAKKNTIADTVKNETGVIITSDGMIMTYFSAITANDSKYKVLTSDGNAYDAEIIKTDSYSNLTFLKINATNLPTISFGNSDDTNLGEKLIFIGNSLENYSNNYSSGILRGFNNSYNLFGPAISSSEKMEGVFEAEIISGKSFVGGPVLNYSGQVVGIIGSRDKNNQSDFFQIPSNKVKRVIDKAINNRLDSNPYLGIYYLPVTKTFAVSNNLKTENGAMVYSASGQQGLAIIAGSPAQKAGLALNDIITKINGQTINSSNTFSDLLYQFKKGDSVELTVMRNGNEVKIKIQL